MFIRTVERIKDIFREIRWAHQRVTRGWDDRAVWSIDYHLAKLIGQLVRELIKDNTGVPMAMYTQEEIGQDRNGTSSEMDKEKEKQWKGILLEIAEGFEAYAENGDCMLMNGNPENFDKAFDLFRTHFSSLWD